MKKNEALQQVDDIETFLRNIPSEENHFSINEEKLGTFTRYWKRRIEEIYGE